MASATSPAEAGRATAPSPPPSPEPPRPDRGVPLPRRRHAVDVAAVPAAHPALADVPGHLPGHRQVVAVLVGLPPVALLALLVGVGRSTGLLDGSSSTGLVASAVPPFAEAPAGAVLLHLAALGLLLTAVLGLHDSALRRGTRPLVAAVAAVVPGACAGGVAVLEPAVVVLAAGLLVAATGAARFVRHRDTHAGFTAGLVLGLVVLVAPVVAAAALLVAASAARWPGSCLRGEPGAGRAVALVLAFPSLAVGASWAYLAWRVPGVVPGLPSPGPLVGSVTAWVAELAAQGQALATVGPAAAAASAVLAAGVLVTAGRTRVVLGATGVVVGALGALCAVLAG